MKKIILAAVLASIVASSAFANQGSLLEALSHQKKGDVDPDVATITFESRASMSGLDFVTELSGDAVVTEVSGTPGLFKVMAKGSKDQVFCQSLPSKTNAVVMCAADQATLAEATARMRYSAKASARGAVASKVGEAPGTSIGGGGVYS